MPKTHENINQGADSGFSHTVIAAAHHLAVTLQQAVQNPGSHLEVILFSVIGSIVVYCLLGMLGRVCCTCLQATMPAAKPSYGRAPNMGLAKPVITIGSFAAYFLGAQAFISPFLDQGLKAVMTICGGTGS